MGDAASEGVVCGSQVRWNARLLFDRRGTGAKAGSPRVLRLAGLMLGWWPGRPVPPRALLPS